MKFYKKRTEGYETEIGDQGSLELCKPDEAEYVLVTKVEVDTWMSEIAKHKQALQIAVSQRNSYIHQIPALHGESNRLEEPEILLRDREIQKVLC